MACQRLLLVTVFAVGVHTQNFGRSFDPSFGFRGAAFFNPNSISFASHRVPFVSQPVTFNTHQGQFFSASGSVNANRIRRPRVPPPRNVGINFQKPSTVYGPSFVTFGVSQTKPTISFSNKDIANPNVPISLSNTNTVPSKTVGAPITFGNVDGTPLPPSGPVVSDPRVPDVDPSSNLPGSVPSGPVTSSPGKQPAVGNSPIVFTPTQNGVSNQGVLQNEHDNCQLKDGLISFNGECSRLLTRSTCNSDQWLVLPDDGVPLCADRACPWEQLEFQGECVDPGNLELCPRGQIPYVYFDGHAECDCEVDHYFDSDSGNCYTYHEQGPCQTSHYIEGQQGGGVTCVPNPCEQDDKVLVDGKCYDKNYKGFCQPELVMILAEDNSADCSFIVPHSIFEVPTLNACPGGSRRDFLGKCRAVFRVASQTSLPSLRGDCPTNFVADPSGTCRKVVSLFG